MKYLVNMVYSISLLYRKGSDFASIYLISVFCVYLESSHECRWFQDLSIYS